MTFEIYMDASNSDEAGLRGGRSISMGEFDMDYATSLKKQSELLVEMGFFAILLIGGIVLANRHEDPINLYYIIASLSVFFFGIYIFKVYIDPSFWTCYVLCLFWYIQSTFAFAIHEWHISKFNPEGGLLITNTTWNWVVGIILVVCAIVFAIRPNIILRPYAITITIILLTLLVVETPMKYSNAVYSLPRTGVRLACYIILYITLANKYKIYVVRILRERVKPQDGNYNHRLPEYTAMIIRRLAIIPEIVYVLYAPVILVVIVFVMHAVFNLIIVQNNILINIDSSKSERHFQEGGHESASPSPVVVASHTAENAEKKKTGDDVPKKEEDVNSFLNNFSKSSSSSLLNIINKIDSE